MQIIPNPTIMALQIVPFVVTLAALYFIIFKPMLAYLEGREQVVAKDRADAERLASELAAKMADYESRLAAARSEATELRACCISTQFGAAAAGAAAVAGERLVPASLSNARLALRPSRAWRSHRGDSVPFAARSKLQVAAGTAARRARTR